MSMKQFKIYTLVFREEVDDYADNRLMAVWAVAKGGSKLLYYLEGSPRHYKLKIIRNFVPYSSQVVKKTPVGKLASMIKESQLTKMFSEVEIDNNNDHGFDGHIWVGW